MHILILFFLAPAIAELLSGSAPPAEFFSFFGLTFMSLLYGAGALLARELRVRWNKGWLTLLLLGIAYGMIEEGLMVKSFFDPGWVDVGLLGSYGRALGVNWVWTVELTAYHAVFSILIPVAIVELLFPARRGRAWLGRKGFWVLLVLFWLDVFFGFAAMTPYRPPFGPYLGTVLVVAGLIFLAYRVPIVPFRPRPVGQPRAAAMDVPTEPAPPDGSLEQLAPRRLVFYLTGLGGVLGLFFNAWVVPNLGVPPFVPVLGILGVAALALWGIRRLAARAAWGDGQRLALLSGALTFLIVLAPLQELDKSRPDSTAGMAIVGLVFAVLLGVFNWRVRRKAELS